MMNSAPAPLRVKKYVSNESNSETTYNTEAIQGLYEEAAAGRSEELYARWQKDFNNVQSSRKQDAPYAGLGSQKERLWETGQT